MSKFLKILKWLISITIILVIIVIGGLYLFFPKEKVRQMAIEEISAALDRKVTIDGISVSIWGGIGAYLEDIKIANASGFEESYFLEAKGLDIKLQFWPLLEKNIQVDRLILNEPKVNLAKLEDGTVNYKFGAIDAAAAQAGVDTGEMSEESKLAVSAISFENLKIEDGILSYRDDSSKIAFTARGLDLSTKLKTEQVNLYHTTGLISVDSVIYKGDSLTMPPVELSINYDALYDLESGELELREAEASLSNIKLHYTAKATTVPEFSAMDVSFNTEVFEIAHLLSLVPQEYQKFLNEYSLQGNLDLIGDLTYENDNFLPQLTANLKGIRIESPDIPGSIVLNDAQLDGTMSEITMTAIEADWMENPFKGTIIFKLEDDLNEYLVKGDLDGAIDLQSLNSMLPSAGEPEIAGEMSYKVNFKTYTHDYSRAELNGTIDITNAAFSATTLPENIEKMNVNLKCTNRDIDVDRLDVQFSSSDLSLKGKLKDAFPYFVPGYEKPAAKPYLTFDYKSNRLDIDKLFPAVAPGEGEALANRPIDSLPPIILPDINGSGTGTIDTLIYTKVEFTNINSKVEIADRKLYVTDVTGKVYSGDIRGDTEIDLNDFNNPQFDGKFNAFDIEADDFLSRFTKFGGHLFGKVNLEGNFNANGLEPDSILNSLTMEGDALFNEARLINFDLANNFSQQFNLDWSTEEAIRDFVSHFRVAEGRAHFDDMKFLSKQGDWVVSGSVGILDGTLDYDCQLLMSQATAEKLASKLGISKSMVSILKDRQSGKYVLPFSLGGTYDKPRANLNIDLKQKMQESLQDNLKDQVTDGLKKLFGN